MGKIQYEVISVIKQSNKGSVYLAKVEGYTFPVIVKQLKRGNRKVFEALQALENEYVPQIYQLEETEEGLLVAEEYIEGELLSEYLMGRALTESQYISIAKQLCYGLGKLHRCVPPVIHRDIKPSNIIVNSEGIVKIIDFDSSRQYKEESESDTRLLGTEKYAAPEQYGFSQTDCRSDIYSLGIVFGMFPKFASEKRKRLWKKMVEKCTLFAPESRYQSVEEVAQEIKKIEKAGVFGWGKVVGVMGGLLLLCGGLFVASKVGSFGKGQEVSTTPVPTLTLSPAPTLSLTPIPTSSPTPEPTPSPSPTPTLAPTPTSSPTPTLTPTPIPTPEPTPSPVPTKKVVKEIPETQEELYRITAPEWRDIESDPEVYVALKQEIRDLNYVVMNCFKDRLGARDFLFQVKELERPGAEYYGTMLYSHLTGQWINIEEPYVELRDGIVHIDGEYMKALAGGYYRLAVRIRRVGESYECEHGVTLYVAESDMLEEPGWWLQNTTLTYYGEEGETLNGVVKNDSGVEIAGLLYRQEAVDESLYRIHCDGKAIEFSEELLRSKSNRDLVMFQMLGTDGSVVDVQITNYTNE